MLLTLAQIGFIWFWLYTNTSALGSVRVTLNRTIVVLGYGWLCSAHNIRPDTLTSLICECLVWLHIGGLCMAVWNRDSRFFRHRYGGLGLLHLMPSPAPRRPERPGWFVYLLRCAGKASKYTRSRLPIKLAYSEPQKSKSAALKREAAIKKLSRPKSPDPKKFCSFR